MDTAPAPIEALVSNALTVTVAPLHEQDRAAWDRQLAVNLTATYLGVKACLPTLTAAVLASRSTSQPSARRLPRGHAWRPPVWRHDDGSLAEW